MPASIFTGTSLRHTTMIEVRESPIHGRGVFACSKISRRTVIGVYEGARYQPGEVPDASAGDSTYLFALSDGVTIDGSRGGNFTRFINHSCQPNCQATETYAKDDSLMIEIKSVRSIPAGDELTIDYALIVAHEERACYPMPVWHISLPGHDGGDRIDRLSGA